MQVNNNKPQHFTFLETIISNCYRFTSMLRFIIFYLHKLLSGFLEKAPSHLTPNTKILCKQTLHHTCNLV